MIDLQKIILIDNHAHSLLTDFTNLDRIDLRRAFSESRSMTMLEEHAQKTLCYMHFLNELGIFLDINGEERLLEMRSSLEGRDYARMLFDSASIGSLIIDAGFNENQNLNLQTFSELIGRVLYRCLRIETFIEQNIATCDTLDEILQLLQDLIHRQDQPKLVALKTIAAYRGGLDLSPVQKSEAVSDFAKAGCESGKSFRLERRPFYSYLLFEIFELAQRNNLPVQIHSGIGDRDSDLRLANPLLFRPILESRRFSKTKFVFLHCYPFVSEAAILSSIYNNVYFDLSLSLTLNSSQAKLLFEDALAVAPYSKVLIGTDGHSVPETYWFASISARRGLKDCLEGLIEKHILTEQQCLDVASHLFFKNAQILYSLDLWSE